MVMSDEHRGKVRVVSSAGWDLSFRHPGAVTVGLAAVAWVAVLLANVVSTPRLPLGRAAVIDWGVPAVKWEVQ